jgi:uncharacterized membrane protein YqaE (UPF0057 family)
MDWSATPESDAHFSPRLSPAVIFLKTGSQLMVLILLLLVCLLAGNAHAGWIDKQGNPLPNSDDRKSAGAFGAQLIFTANDQLA